MPRNTVPELPDFDIEFEEGFFETLDEEFADHGLEAVLEGPTPDPDEDEDPDSSEEFAADCDRLFQQTQDFGEDDDWFDVREDDHDAFDLNDDGEHDWN